MDKLHVKCLLNADDQAELSACELQPTVTKMKDFSQEKSLKNTPPSINTFPLYLTPSIINSIPTQEAGNALATALSFIKKRGCARNSYRVHGHTTNRFVFSVDRSDPDPALDCSFGFNLHTGLAFDSVQEKLSQARPVRDAVGAAVRRRRGCPRQIGRVVRRAGEGHANGRAIILGHGARPWENYRPWRAARAARAARDELWNVARAELLS
ncbi:hypothetical protein EVAR_94693_1 [Eumeta japonica]|uniref:Uncharacterized protein n=1 Tax=Eumeta variegata TaxID=151549 RepID=A0A4C1UVJ3_EUMVA|nr:hypothetical protein EVAR_94693_1 [Eumeta japonica]